MEHLKLNTNKLASNYRNVCDWGGATFSLYRNISSQPTLIINLNNSLFPWLREDTVNVRSITINCHFLFCWCKWNCVTFIYTNFFFFPKYYTQQTRCTKTFEVSTLLLYIKKRKKKWDARFKIKSSIHFTQPNLTELMVVSREP